MAQIREQLERILSDPAFSGANRRSRLLRYLVEQGLENRQESLKEAVIAVDVFDRQPDYDPQVDSLVRVEVGRLRTRLAEYYGKTESEEPVRIEIPRGGYRPAFVFRDPAPAADLPVAGPAARDLTPPRRGWLRRKWALAGIAASILAIGFGVAALWHRSAPAAPESIAVLPFLNLGGDAADDYLGDGISEELTESLAEFNNLRVVARTSAFQYRGKGADVREIGGKLRAGAVLEGSVARRGGQLRVIAQLIRTSDGYHLWSHTYDATLAQLPAVEEGIARVAREKLALASPVEVREASTTRSPEAHDLYIRAAYELNQRTAESTRQAIALASQATEKDPSFAQPYVLMATGEAQLNTLLAQAPHMGAERAWQYVAKALALDPGNSGAHAQKALLAYTDQWDWPQAENEFRLALASGSHGSAENLYGWCLMTRGRFEESRRHLQVAAELDPLSLGPQLNQVEEWLSERDYRAARAKVERILQTAPANSVALTLATTTAFWQRDCSAVTAWNRKLLATYPKAVSDRLRIFSPEVLCEHPDEAKTALSSMMRNPLPGYFSPYRIAAVFAVGQDVDQAIFYLEKSAELREPVLLEVGVDRSFDAIRQDSRLKALERRIGLVD